MKVLLSWVHSFLPIQPTAKEIAEKLTSTGVEVSSCQNLSAGLERVVVAKIESTKPHPNADRLTLCDVTTGSEKFNIVCGARNMKTGDHVALALPNALLPNGMAIKKSKIRGEPSEGMLCSEIELGFSEASEGILILPPETRLGEPLADALKKNDWLLEFEITPNRGDCLSVIGLAREIAAALGVAPKIPAGEGEGPADGTLKAVVHDAVGAPRYVVREIEALSHKATPPWMKGRLEAAGVRSINNLVDVTNYVMLEWGQPLHAFDREKIVGSILVRRAKAGEKILCLDAVERSLTPEDLVIADGKGPVAIAGVIGGERTAVSDQTKSILLESAHFDPRTVRKTARRLGLRTESSHRFERWVDPSNVWSASERAVELYAEAAGGKRLGGIDVRGRSFAHRKLHLRQQTIRRILGDDVKNAGEYLSRLGLPVEKKDDGWTVEIPTRRSDLEREIDLVEEVARLHGFGQIAPEIPPLTREPTLKTLFDTVLAVRRHCRSMGLIEARGYSFGKEEDQDALSWAGLGKPLRLANPLASDAAVMRQSVLSSLLNAWSVNRSRQIEGVRLFEVGTIFGTSDGSVATPAKEELHLGVLIAGKTYGRGWFEKDRSPDLFDTKGIFEALAEEFSWGRFSWKSDGISSYLHPGKASSIHRGSIKVGEVGELHPKIARAYDTGEAVILDLHLDPLLVSVEANVRFKPLSPYPLVRRDLAFIVSSDVTADTLQSEIFKLRDPLLTAVELFDVYEGKGVPEGHRSVAYALTFGSMERTLTEPEVSTSLKSVVDRLATQFGAKLRS